MAGELAVAKVAQEARHRRTRERIQGACKRPMMRRMAVEWV